MAAVPLPSRSEVSRELTALLEPSHELFACEVASGVSLKDAAVTAGFSEYYGTDLLAKDSVRRRISELLAQRSAEGFPPCTWIEAQMVAQYRRLATLPPPDEETRAASSAAVGVLMNLAKLKGYIVDKSSKLSAKVDLGKIPSHQVREVFASRLNDLSPGARAQLEALTLEVQAEQDETPMMPNKKEA
jgi:hypothetical protein